MYRRIFDDGFYRSYESLFVWMHKYFIIEIEFGIDYRK